MLLRTTAVTFELNKDWLFFPNATRTVINIQSPVAIEVITLIDVKGTVVLERIFKSVDVLAHSNLDLTNVPAGLYFLKVQTANGLEVERIVVGK